MTQPFSQRRYIQGCRTVRVEWIQAKTIVYGAFPGGRFIGDLILEYIDGVNWRLVKEFKYVAKSGKVYTMPEGFITDFASTPRFLWCILPPTGSYGPSAVLHDFIYRMQLEDQATADALLRESCESLGVARWKIFMLYYGVHLFGSNAYTKSASNLGRKI